jgi:hypothetical protein
MNNVISNEGGIRFTSHRITGKVHHVFFVNLSSLERDLRATIVWWDPPISSISELVTFADLDLCIEAPNGSYFYAKSRDDTEETYSTSEKIVINQSDLAIGLWAIHVIANPFPMRTEIDYSIVVNGPFPQFSDSVFAPEIAQTTQCDEFHTGMNCQTNVVEIVDRITVAVTPRKTLFFMLSVPENCSKYIVINSTRTVRGTAVSRFVFNSNSNQMAIPQFLTATQTESSDFLFIPSDGLGPRLYIAIFEDFLRSGSHSLNWFTTDLEPSEFEWSASGHKNAIPGATIAWLAVTAIVLCAVVGCLIRRIFILSQGYNVEISGIQEALVINSGK